MWYYLTGKNAAINYEFVDMTVEVQRDTGPDSPQATWKLDGTLRITRSPSVALGHPLAVARMLARLVLRRLRSD